MRADPPFIRFPVVRQPESSCNPTVASRQLNRIKYHTLLSADMQVMKGEQIQASGLDYLVGLHRSHVAVVTEGYVPVVCENGTQRLAPIMVLQINSITCGGADPLLQNRPEL